MSADTLFLISGICYGTAALSFLAGAIIWFAAEIPGTYLTLKGLEKKKIPGTVKVKMIEDIVMTDCVSTLDD